MIINYFNMKGKHEMTLDLLPLPENSPIVIAGKIANQAAARQVFIDYRTRKAANTIRRQDADLQLFADYLNSANIPVGDLAIDPKAWQGMTWGLIEGFVKWQLLQGYAVDSVNVRLSTVKQYAQLALKAGALDVSEYAMIRTVRGYSHKEKPNIDSTRKAEGLDTRRTVKARMTQKNNEQVTTSKKAEPIFLTKEQRDIITASDGTPQGKRDALIMCLMLEHGLRVGEVAILQRDAFNLAAGTITFERPKTKTKQTDRLTERTLQAVKAYLKIAPKTGSIWRASAMKNQGKAKQGKLTKQGMTAGAIYKRVELAGRKAGIEGLSPHDLRHTFAERARHNPTKLLQDAGGWNSPAMALRYQARGAIANDGLILED
jgi:integrase